MSRKELGLTVAVALFIVLCIIAGGVWPWLIR
jgi:hypothetical protein